MGSANQQLSRQPCPLLPGPPERRRAVAQQSAQNKNQKLVRFGKRFTQYLGQCYLRLDLSSPKLWWRTSVVPFMRTGRMHFGFGECGRDRKWLHLRSLTKSVATTSFGCFFHSRHQTMPTSGIVSAPN